MTIGEKHAGSKVLITGAKGQLGREFCRLLGTEAIGCDRPHGDVTDAVAVRRLFDTFRPAVLLHCAAYTQVDRAEDDEERCRAVNATAVRHLAEACARFDCLLVQISTDYVFGADESRDTPYDETNRPGPVNVYGQTKLEGESAAAECPRHLIVRTCGLYSGESTAVNFPATMLRLGAARRELRVVDDQHCTPSYVPDVAAAILNLVRHDATGVYHVVNSGHTTWYEFARALFDERAGEVSLAPITSDQYASRARRPRYSVLSTGKYERLAGVALPSWRDGLRAYLATL